MVLRKAPPGTLLASAHRMDREYNIISALSSAGLPVPHTMALCTDKSVLGTDFYLMEYVEGVVHYE